MPRWGRSVQFFCLSSILSFALLRFSLWCFSWELCFIRFRLSICVLVCQILPSYYFTVAQIYLKEKIRCPVSYGYGILIDVMMLFCHWPQPPLVLPRWGDVGYSELSWTGWCWLLLLISQTFHFIGIFVQFGASSVPTWGKHVTQHGQARCPTWARLLHGCCPFVPNMADSVRA